MPWVVASVAAARPPSTPAPTLRLAASSAAPHYIAALLLLTAATATATATAAAAAAAFLASPCGSSQSQSARFPRPHRCYASATPTTPTPQPPAACRPTTVTGRPARRLLIVGDGDFSFSRAILPLLSSTTGDVVTTCLHPSKEELVARYPTAASNLDGLLNDARVRVGFGVDATDLAGTLRRATVADGDDGRRFDRVVWNFPHCLGKANIAANRQLLTVRVCASWLGYRFGLWVHLCMTETWI